MASPHRHDEMVAAMAALAHTTPLGPADLPPLSSDRIDAAREAASSALHEAEHEHRTATAELESVRAQHQRATNAVERAEAAVAAAGEDRAAAERAGDERREELTRIDTATEELDQRSAECAAAAEQLTALLGHVDLALDVPHWPVAERGLDAALDALRVVAADLSDVGLDVAARSFVDWADAIAAGNAPVDPAAAALLDELDRTERSWADGGAGDVSADPAVMDARAEVLSYQTTVSELELQARTGVLGERARSAIERASAQRAELEALGRKGDPAELAAAREAEQAALSDLGFDSMLEFRVVMSSVGVGSLAGKRREVAAERLAAAQSALERELERSRTRHAELRARLDGLAVRAAALTEGDPRPTRDVLAHWYAVPEAALQARREVARRIDALGVTLTQHRVDLAAAEVRRQEVTDELDTLVSTIEDAQLVITTAGAERTAAAIEVTSAEVSLATVERRLRQAELRLGSAGSELDQLRNRRYLDADVAELRSALVSAIQRRTAVDHDDDVEGGENGEGGEDGEERAGGVVLDDPLVQLDAADALAVFGSLLGIDWPTDVIYVSSRRELLARARRLDGSVRCVDGRRRLRGLRRLRLRQDPLRSLAS